MPVLKKKKSNDKVQILKRVDLDLDTPNLLIVKSAAADAIKTVNNFAQSFASLIEAQQRMAANLQASLNPIIKAHEQMAENLTKIALPEITKTLDFGFKTLPNFAELLPKNNSIFEAVQSGFRLANTFNMERFTGMTRLVQNLQETINFKFVDVFANITRTAQNFAGTIAEFANSIIGRVQETVGQLFQFIKRSNILIIISASKGDQLALHQLGKLWWRLNYLYMEIEKQKGRKPSKKEFQGMVQVICWEVIREADERQTPFFEVARIVYYSIIGKLFADYVEIHQTEQLTEATEVKILNQKYRSSVNIYRDADNKPSLFVKTVAQELLVSPQTVRNWVKSGQIQGIKVSYFSRMRQAIVPAYLLPYQTNILTELKAIKDKQDKRKRHQLDGYFTISEVASWYNLSRKTLERWDKQGLLVPNRIDGIRYYTEAQRDQVPKILLNNGSPKIKGLIASHKNLLLS